MSPIAARLAWIGRRGRARRTQGELVLRESVIRSPLLPSRRRIALPHFHPLVSSFVSVLPNRKRSKQQPTNIIMEGDAQSHRSRATGVSRKSSITSRQSQLIKKNTGAFSPLTLLLLLLGSLDSEGTDAVCCHTAGPTDLRPSDILIERFEAWKNITKNLIAYFEGESSSSAALITRASRTEHEGGDPGNRRGEWRETLAYRRGERINVPSFVSRYRGEATCVQATRCNAAA